MPGPVKRLVDVNCSRIQFRPGDRVIVRTHAALTRDETKRLRKRIEKWAGPDVEVLVVDLRLMEVEIEHRGPTAE